MAIEQQEDFLKVSARDVEIGKPLAYALYDGNRKLLLKQGYIIETVHQCESLMERGLYRNLRDRLLPGEPPVAKEVPRSRESMTTLDATKLRVGDVMQLQSGPESPRLVVKLIGYLKNRGLIVTVPEADGEFVMLKDGQSFVVRFFSGQNAYAFTSTVTRQTSVPFPHVHLAYPREVRGLVIRKDSRIDVELIAAISKEGAGANTTAAGKIVNLSTGGAALRAKERLGNKGDAIEVKFKVLINDIQSYVVFQSEICTIADDKADPVMPYMHGIRFVSPDQATSLALAAFVYQKIVDQSY